MGLNGGLGDGTSHGLSTLGATSGLLLSTVLHGGSHTTSLRASTASLRTGTSPATSVLSGTTSRHGGLVLRVEVHGHGEGRESSHLLLHVVEVVDVTDGVSLLLPFLLAAEIFGSSFFALMETNVRLSFGQEEVTDFGGSETFGQGSSGIIFSTESDETETGLLLGVLGDPVLAGNTGDFTELGEDGLEDGFVDFGLDVLDEEVGNILALLILSLQVSGSFGFTLMPADVEGFIRAIHSDGVGTEVFDGLLSAFLVSVADEGKVFILSRVLLDQKGFDLTVLGENILDGGFEITFVCLGKIFNVNVLLGGSFRSLVLRNERM